LSKESESPWDAFISHAREDKAQVVPKEIDSVQALSR